MREIVFLKALRDVFQRHDAERYLPGTNVSGVCGLITEDIVDRAGEDEEGTETNMKSRECDVLVIAPLIMELRMCALALGIDFEKPSRRENALPVFEIELERRDLPPLKAVLRTLNKQRNIHSASKTAEWLAAYRPALSVLVGIAGARHDRGMADVICASEVFYDAGGVLTPKGKLAEDDRFEVTEDVFNCIKMYEEARNEATNKDTMAQHFYNLAGKINGDKPNSDELVRAELKFRVEKLMSGEALRRDGKFSKESIQKNRLISMVEMEAAGFAGACRQFKVDWMVFRGACDYADPDKNDKWQRVAALHAAFEFSRCIQIFRKQEEMDL